MVSLARPAKYGAEIMHMWPEGLTDPYIRPKVSQGDSERKRAERFSDPYPIRARYLCAKSRTLLKDIEWIKSQNDSG